MVNPVIPSPIPTLPTPATPLPSRGQVALQIIDTTGDLRDVKTPIPQINGEIKSASRDGTVIIHTDRGDITAKLPAQTSAQPGTQITIDIPSGKPPTSVTVQVRPASPDQPAPPQDPSTTVPKTSQGQLELNETLRATAQLPSNPNSNTVAPGQIVQIKPITLAAALTILQPNLPTLTTMTTAGVLPPPQLAMLQNMLKILAPGSSPAPSNPLPTQPLGMIPPSAAPLPVPGAPPIIPTGSPQPPADMPGTPAPFSPPPVIPDAFEARIDQITLPTPTSPAPATQQGPLTLFTLATDPQGHIVFANAQQTITPSPTPIPQFFLMPTRGDNIIPGTTLTLTPQPLLPVSLPTTATPLGALGDATTDTIIALLNTLPDLDVATIYGPTHTTPPIPSDKSPTTAAPAMLFFLAALRSGDMDGWLGTPATNALKNLKKSGALEKLSDLFRTGKQTLAEAPSGDFKSYIFPMQFDQTIHAIKLHMRHEGNDDGDNNGQPHDNQRFILEVNFDRLGPVQLDMLYKPQQLDTVLRTQLPLSAPMRSTLELTYTDAMGTVGHTGTLYFQDGLNAWVTVDERPDTAMQVLA